MATDLGKAYVQIIPSSRDLTKDIEKELGGAADQAGTKSGRSFASKFKLAIVGAAIGKFIANAVTEGGELEQNLDGTSAVFGEFAGSIQDSAQDAYKNMGLSASDYMATANKMGSLFQGSGMDQQKSLDMTADAMQRAADVASVMGIDTSMAMESIAGAAKGNFTMMDNLGVAMNATALEAYALEKGVNFKWNTATQAEKSELAMKMFMERTSQYAGNFARESEETFTGSLGAMKSSWQNVLGSMATGQDIGPALSALSTSLVTFVQNLMPMVTSILTQLPTVIVTLITESGPQLIETGAQAIASILTGLSQALPTLIPVAVEAIMTMINTLLENMPLIVDGALQLMTGLAEGMIAAIPVLVEKLPEIIDTMITTLIDLIPLIIDAGIELLTSLITELPTIITTIVTRLPEIIDSIVTTLLNNIPLLIQAGVDLLISLVQNLPAIIAGVVAAIPTIVTGLVGAIVDNIPMIVQAGVDLLVSLVKNLPAIIVEIVKAVPQIVTGIVSAFGDLMGSIITIGGDIVRGIWEGITGVADWLWNKVKGWASSIFDGIKNFFGIKSPSKLFATIGEELPAGLADGIDDNAKVVTKAMDDMGDLATRSFESDLAFNASTSGSLGGLSASLDSGVYSTADASRKVPAQVTFSLAGHAFSALVDDITSLQDRTVELALAY